MKITYHCRKAFSHSPGISVVLISKAMSICLYHEYETALLRNVSQLYHPKALWRIWILLRFKIALFYKHFHRGLDQPALARY